MADGFRVDLAALQAAADGIRRTLDQVSARAIGPVGAAAGHDALGRVLDDFGERWRRGVQALVEDGRAMGEQLTGDAAAYRAVDDLGRDGVDVLRGPGPDPAAG